MATYFMAAASMDKTTLDVCREMSITQKNFLLGKLCVSKPQAVNSAAAFLNPYLPLPHSHCVCALASDTVSVKERCACYLVVSDACQDQGFAP